MKMKFIVKVLAFMAALVINGLTNAFSQAVVPNGSFEEWKTDSLFSAPSNWFSSPVLDGSTETVFKIDDDATEGTTSIKLLSLLDYDYVADGVVLLGNVGEMISGIPWNQTIDKLHFSIKYNIVDGDAGFILLNLYKADTVMAMASYAATGASSDWIDMSLPIVYDGDGSPIQPEQLFLAFVSSYPNEIPEELVGPDFNPNLYQIKEGSWIMVDNVYFTMGASTDKILPPNNSFEDWFVVTSTDPKGWRSNNLEFYDAAAVPVTKTTDAADGTYAARMEVMDIHGWSEAYLSLGNMDSGIVFTEKPMALGYSYKYEPVNGDQGHINLSFSGELYNFYTTYYGGFGQTLEASSEYKDAFALIEMGGADEFTPHRMVLNISAGQQTGSVLYIDNIRFLEMYDVNLTIQDANTNQAIPFAQATISAFDYPMQADVNGQLSLKLPAGTYQFTIASQGYTTNNGELAVPLDNDAKTILLTPFAPDPSMPVVNIIDDDEDKVYFTNDTFKAIVHLPANIPITVPNGTEVVLTQYLYTNVADEPEAYTVFQDGTLNVSTINDGSFTIFGVVGDVNKVGVIGFKVAVNYLVLFEVGTYPVADTYSYNPDLSNRGLAFVGLSLPESAGVTLAPALNKIANLYGYSENPVNNKPISFIKQGLGLITYDAGLNFIDNREQLSALGSGLHIMASNETGYYAEIDPAQLSFLTNRGMVITIGNIPSGVLKDSISVFQSPFGSEPDEWSWEIDLSQAQLNTGNFSFPIWNSGRFTLQIKDVNTAVESNVSNGKIGVYPNPAGDEVYISGSGILLKATITDLKGTVMIKHSFKGERVINVKAIDPGYYILQLELENGEHVVRTVLKK